LHNGCEVIDGRIGDIVVDDADEPDESETLVIARFRKSLPYANVSENNKGP
jgi:hypothetical protein